MEDDSRLEQAFEIIYKYSRDLLKFAYQFYDTTIHQFSTVALGCISFTVKRLMMQHFQLPISLLAHM